VDGAVSILDISPVIPVVVLDDPTSAVPVARALLAGGIRIIEVTLRTPTALECITRIAAEVPEMAVGAGTVTRPSEVESAIRAGAQFLVSPGTTMALAEELCRADVPALPGCATVTEVLELRDRGFRELKAFPGESVGGHAFLSSVFGPIPEVRFCPTGGITVESAPAYLLLPNVPCVGGTWLAPAAVIREGAWGTIAELASAAMAALDR